MVSQDRTISLDEQAPQGRKGGTNGLEFPLVEVADAVNDDERQAPSEVDDLQGSESEKE